MCTVLNIIIKSSNSPLRLRNVIVILGTSVFPYEPHLFYRVYLYVQSYVFHKIIRLLHISFKMRIFYIFFNAGPQNQAGYLYCKSPTVSIGVYQSLQTLFYYKSSNVTVIQVTYCSHQMIQRLLCYGKDRDSFRTTRFEFWLIFFKNVEDL